MVDSSAKTRYCFVNPKGGKVKIILSIGESMISGSDFKLYNQEKNKVLEQFKISADGNKAGEYVLQTFAKDLHLTHLLWSVICCSKNSQIYSTMVKVELIQDGVPLKLTFPAEKHLVNVPPCVIQKTDNYNGALTIMIKQ